MTVDLPRPATHRLVALPARPAVTEAPPDAPALPPGEWVELPDRGRLFVRRADGPAGAPTVFLLHGWTVTSDLNWFPATEALAEHVNVVMFDHRGHGHGIRSWRRFTMSRCADDTVALADALGVDRLVPVGYSMGGAVAQVIWRRHPDRVHGLVLAATAARFKVTRRHLWEFPALTGLSVVSRVAPSPAHRPILDTLITRRTRERDLHPWILAEIRKNNLREITEAGSQIGRFDSREWVSGIDVPTGIITVGDDRLVPTSGQLALAQRLPHARHWHLGGGHDMCVTRPHEFVPALVDAVKHAIGT